MKERTTRETADPAGAITVNTLIPQEANQFQVSVHDNPICSAS